MSTEPYHPESYWTEVGQRIEQRDNGENVIAGDDEPYYRYKRKKFLELLTSVDFYKKSILEIGHGPGGNLIEIFKLKPARLTGVDISEQMVKLAKNKVSREVEIIKIDGTHLPFKDGEFDIVFTATVLQHNTIETMLLDLMKEIARVSGNKVFIFERVEDKITGDDLCLGRPVQYYADIMYQHGFTLKSTRFINIRISYYVCGAIRKLLNPGNRKEGEPLNKISVILQNVFLPFTAILDKIFTSQKDLCRIEFERTR